MAAGDQITAADLASGVNYARAQGANTAREIQASHDEAQRARDEFYANLKKSRKQALVGDVAMIAATIAPWALPALGAALGAGGATAGAGAAATGAGGAATGLRNAAKVLGTASTAAAPAATGFAAGIPTLLKSASALQPYAGSLGQIVGNLAGQPTPLGAGVSSLINDVRDRADVRDRWQNPGGALPGETEADRIRRLRANPGGSYAP